MRVRKLLGQPIPRAPGVETRVVAVGLAGRFADELIGGLPAVLMPTIRQNLGLSLLQVGLLEQALYYVAALVEPGFALLIDIGRRPWLMAFGAAGIGLAVITMGLAGGFGMLLAGYVIYGLTSGPLAHTADVVLVEAHPEAPGRIFARATAYDTIGAFLAPLSVPLAFALGWGWRGVMVGGGSLGLLYAMVILATRFPPPRELADAEPESTASGISDASESVATEASKARITTATRVRGLLSTFRRNLRTVMASPVARRWLIFLLLFEVVEAPWRFQTIWLAEQAGMGQGLVGGYRAFEMAVGFVALLVLDRGLSGIDQNHLLKRTSQLLLLIYPAWLLVPGIASRFVIGLPLSFLMALYWPIGRGQALVSVPGKAGALTAVTALYGLLPINVGMGWLAQRIGLTPAMLLVFGIGLLGMLITLELATRTGPPDPSTGRAADSSVAELG